MMTITANTLGNKFWMLFLNISPKECPENQALPSSFLHWTFCTCKAICFSKNLDLLGYQIMHVMDKKITCSDIRFFTRQHSIKNLKMFLNCVKMASYFEMFSMSQNNWISFEMSLRTINSCFSGFHLPWSWHLTLEALPYNIFKIGVWPKNEQKLSYGERNYAYNTVSITLYTHWVVNTFKHQQRLLKHCISVNVYFNLSDVFSATASCWYSSGLVVIFLLM